MAFAPKKKLKESLFWKAVLSIREHPFRYVLTVVLDFVFLGIIVLVGNFLTGIVPSDPQALLAMFGGKASLVLFSLAYPLAYYLFLVLVYSVIKWFVLEQIAVINGKGKSSMSQFGRFYLLNVWLFIIIVGVALLFFVALRVVFEDKFFRPAFSIVSVPLLFFSYALINLSHTPYLLGKRQKVITHAIRRAFLEIFRYGGFFLWDILVGGICYLILTLLHLALRQLVLGSTQAMAQYGTLYVGVFQALSLVVLYLLIAMNRIYFLDEAERNVRP